MDYTDSTDKKAICVICRFLRIVMFRTFAFALVVIAAIASGCRRNDSVKPDTKVEVLPAVQSKAGGEMLLIPAGSFAMGDAAGRDDETPHAVSVSAFYLDKHTVTQELYAKVMGANPSKRKDPKCPVERTQWTDAVRFCNK